MNNWTPRTEQLSQLPLLATVTRTKEQLDAIRPLSKEVEGRVMQKIRLEWNFHSNAIEGNKLTFGETYSFLMYGLTAKGKPLKDHLDIRGHNEAVNFLLSIIKDDRDLTESEIRELHKMILVEPYQSPAQTVDGQATSKTIRIGEYKHKPNHVKTITGEIHYYANSEDVPMLMGELVAWYNAARKNDTIHPSVLAAFVHHRFVAIHPFDDGNGRLARILMNLILMQKGYPPAVVKLKERTDYYAALAQADKNEYEAIVEFVAESVLDSMNLYLKAAKGENIDEDADLDKEIALFKQELGIKQGKKPSIKTHESIKNTLEEVIKPFLLNLDIRLKELDTLFFDRTIEFLVDVETEGLARMTTDEISKIMENSATKISNRYSLKPNEWQSKHLRRFCFSNKWIKYQGNSRVFDMKFSIIFNFGKGQYSLEVMIDDDLVVNKGQFLGEDKYLTNIGKGLYGIANLDDMKSWTNTIIKHLMNEIKKEVSIQY